MRQKSIRFATYVTRVMMYAVHVVQRYTYGFIHPCLHCPNVPNLPWPQHHSPFRPGLFAYVLMLICIKLVCIKDV